MKRLTLLLGFVALGVASAMAQGANNIKINEVMENNTSSIQDEFGGHGPWVELVNTAYSSYNVRGMYITTNRDVLDPNMPADQRMKLMSQIPNDESRTALSARKHVVFFLNSNPSKGRLHLSEKLDSTSTWIALYDGNGVDLIDSVSLPAVEANCSYARVKDGADEWMKRTPNDVTPGISNENEAFASKIDKLKKDDPHGFGITLICMGIVFLCLLILCIFFTLIGRYFKKNNEQPASVADIPVAPAVSAKENNAEEEGAIMAVIALALKEQLDSVHDEESGIITIKPRNTTWTGVGMNTPIPTINK